ncbi:MAG TPA: hypothetical protein VER36_08455, partial [Flavisolibacter sp.]|nr:hypothetical protein [Flavisolibacter sp.]
YTHKTTDPAALQDKLQSHATKEGQRTKRKEASTVQNTTVKAKTSTKTKVKSAHQQLNTDLPQNSISISQQESHTEKAKISPREIEDSLKTGDSLTIVPRPKKDTAALKDTIAKKIAEPMVSNEPKQGSQKKAAFFFSAGVGMQRAIALNSQRSSDFNYKGRRSTVSDLLPSVYLRLQKGKWFAQAEFQYAAPQPVKQFSFSQKTRYDAASLNLNTERFTVQKLYYHQLPFSINYHLLENWSVGAGTVYSILAGAVTEQEVESKNLQTGVANVTRNVAPVQGYRDSFFYKTTAGILVQTDYHWKRFSLGLRFTQNLQPFIKYTKPDGTVLDEKNKVLQAMLRFRLF